VSSPNVLGDATGNIATGVVDMSFVVPGTSNAGMTDSVSFYVIDAESIGATVTAYDPDNNIVFGPTAYHGGQRSQELVTISSPRIASVHVTLGSGLDTSALDNVSFDTPVAINHTPVLQPIGTLNVNEQTNLSFTAQASDADAGQTLTYALGGTVPTGVSFSTTTGAFSWTPTEAQGPGTYPMSLTVTDNGSPALSAMQNFTVNVAEVNQAPVLQPVANITSNNGSTVTFQAVATDADIPANTLTYSLTGTIPAGASINANTGLFTYTPGAADGVYPMTVIVTDNGIPPLSASQNFTLLVDTIKPTVSSVDISSTSIQVHFLDAGGVDPATATNTANYTLIASGGDGTFNDGNEINRSSAISSVSFDASTQTATLNLNTTLPDDVYRVTVLSGITDLAGNALASPTSTPVSYQSSGWRYQEVGWGGDAGFQSGVEPAGFATGTAAFGNYTTGPGPSATNWDPNTDMLLRRNVIIPASGLGVNVAVAIDNDVQVWFNGVDISGGMRTSDGYAQTDRYVFAVPDSLVHVGAINLLAIRAHDRGGGTYIDAAVRVTNANSFVTDVPLNTIASTVAVSLNAADDSGVSNSDGITSVTAPRFDVTVNKAGIIGLDYTGDGVADATLTVPAAGTYTIAAPALAQGERTVTATFAAAAGGTAQATMPLTLDTTGPRVTGMSPTGNAGGAADHVDVTFDSPLDDRTVTTSAFSLAGPAGPVAISGV
ncbi:MAG: putative Ig domain-containing protein, partial [Tepidisphaeraceae bacterium]